MRFLNSLLEGIKIAFLALSINKTRSFLTALCIIIGITMVSVVDAVTTGMDESFDNSMAMLGTNVVYIEKWPWDDDMDWWEIAGRKEMKIEYVDFLAERTKYASNISASANTNVNIRYKDKNAERVQLSGTTSNHLDVQGLDIAEGRMYTQEEVRTAANVVVVGASLKEALFEEQDALGKQIRIGGQRFIVIGVLEKQGSFLGLGDADNVALIPIYAFNEVYGLRRGIQLGVKFPDEAALQEGEYEIEGLMRQVRQLDATAENDFAINKPEAFKELLEGFKRILYLVGFGLVGLSLLIGGIGVMNIMFVSVRERTKEIGIRKAVGAKSWEILSQFLIEAIAICVSGGVIGVGLAAIATFFIDKAFTATMNFGVVGFAFLICTMVGVVFGFIPAYRAAKSDPIESLRFE
ncbi:MAG: ABC transporter permease [Balneola sp.]|uniref:ABC transporter permease n=1 Tax=Balneola sp. EhC07 TaxID=1849360 RepID=UPI0007F51CF0|nr:ABC transporter permease [Balneola sp. EhC07]OAN62068.1 hypothetical protein A8B79_03760 [Balneola sp. EhC07]